MVALRVHSVQTMTRVFWSEIEFVQFFPVNIIYVTWTDSKFHLDLLNC